MTDATDGDYPSFKRSIQASIDDQDPEGCVGGCLDLWQRLHQQVEPFVRDNRADVADDHRFRGEAKLSAKLIVRPPRREPFDFNAVGQVTHVTRLTKTPVDFFDEPLSDGQAAGYGVGVPAQAV